MAVVDWELSTLGDPLADLGLTLTYWHDIGDTERAIVTVAQGVTAHPGFPTADEFAQAAVELTMVDAGVVSGRTIGHSQVLDGSFRPFTVA